jgi:hypothetical protein
MPSCAIAGEASAKAPANNAAAKIKIFRIVILPSQNSKPSPVTNHYSPINSVAA